MSYPAHAEGLVNMIGRTGVLDTRQYQQGKSRKEKQSTNIKRYEINFMNIINDNIFYLRNSLLDNDSRYMNVTLKSKPTGVAIFVNL